MIATEAAAEGINLQFCNLVVNYDLPWNPQRIEQRIGRCHRYGQKFDVVVVNFLNKNNAADQRVYELLDDKFRLFNGVFGASDEVLGAVESGVDFEKRIATIYQKCRTPQQIQFEFDQLQRELDAEIAAGQRDAREKLLDNFDQEVIEKVRIQSAGFMDRFNERLWMLTRHLLAGYAAFDAHAYSFQLIRNPFPGVTIHPGPYRIGKNIQDANTYRVGHPLAQRVLAQAKALTLSPAEVTFDYSTSGKNIAVVATLTGKSGWITCSLLTVNSLETEESVIFAGLTDSGESLDESQYRRLFDLPGEVGNVIAVPVDVTSRLADDTVRRQSELLRIMAAKNGEWFDTEIDKLDRWADDLKETIGREIKELEVEIRAAKKEARQASTLEQKVEGHKRAKELEKKLKDKRKGRDEADDEIESRKDSLIDEIESRLKQRIDTRELFTVRWTVA